MVTVRLFASLQDIVGTAMLDVAIPGPTTAGAVYEQLKLTYPKLSQYQPPILVAVNEEYGHWDSPVKAGDEVAFFPPVSGGSR